MPRPASAGICPSASRHVCKLNPLPVYCSKRILFQNSFELAKPQPKKPEDRKPRTPTHIVEE